MAATQKPPYPHLPKAPIIEALIDIRVEARSGTTLDQLRALGDRVTNDYPTIEPRKNLKVRLGAKESRAEESGVQIQSGQTADGYFFKSADGRRVAQARLAGFAFSMLRPYTEWADLRREASRLWHEYVETVQPLKIRRLAVRFTNGIELPLPVDIEDYFRTAPILARSLPQNIGALFMRLGIDYGDCFAVITQGVAEVADTNPDPVTATIIFDIDASRRVALPVDNEEAWKQLDRLREVKNEIFFESMTPRALELFR